MYGDKITSTPLRTCTLLDLALLQELRQNSQLGEPLACVRASHRDKLQLLRQACETSQPQTHTNNTSTNKHRLQHCHNQLKGQRSSKARVETVATYHCTEESLYRSSGRRNYPTKFYCFEGSLGFKPSFLFSISKTFFRTRRRIGRPPADYSRRFGRSVLLVRLTLEES